MNPFKKGDRVKPSSYSSFRFRVNYREVPLSEVRGTVATYPRSPERVNVRIDGQKNPSVFAVKFWEKVDD